jgi:hypothetical protein
VRMGDQLQLSVGANQAAFIGLYMKCPLVVQSKPGVCPRPITLLAD